MELKSSMSKLAPIFDAISDSKLKEKIIFAYNDLDDKNNPLHLDDKYGPIYRNATMSEAPAGKFRHHSYEGGLIDHLREMWDFSNEIWEIESFKANRDFTKEDVAVGILLHDLSKAIAFRYNDKSENSSSNKNNDSFFKYRDNFFNPMTYDQRTLWLMSKYGIGVSENVFNAILYTEGGWSEVANIKGYNGEVGKLGYYMHILDLYSSQIIGKKYFSF